MKFQGSAKAKPGKLIELAGSATASTASSFGQRRATPHQRWQLDDRGRVRHVGGLVAERRDLVAPPPPGLLSGVSKACRSGW